MRATEINDFCLPQASRRMRCEKQVTPHPLRVRSAPSPTGEGCLCVCTDSEGSASSTTRCIIKVTSPLESHKGSFVDPIVAVAPRFCIGSLRLIVIIRSKVQGSLSKTSSRWRSLRMTSLNDICGSAIISSGRRGSEAARAQ